MLNRLRFLSYTLCTLVAFLTLGSAPRAPVARARDLDVAVVLVSTAGDADPE